MTQTFERYFATFQNLFQQFLTSICVEIFQALFTSISTSRSHTKNDYTDYLVDESQLSSRWPHPLKSGPNLLNHVSTQIMSPKGYTWQPFFGTAFPIAFYSALRLSAIFDATRQKTFAQANNVHIFRRGIAAFNAQNSSTSLILRRGPDVVVENGTPCPPGPLVLKKRRQSAKQYARRYRKASLRR